MARCYRPAPCWCLSCRSRSTSRRRYYERMSRVFQPKALLTPQGARVHRHRVQPRPDPADAAAYTLSEAAALIDVPVSTLHKWTKGRTFPTKNGARTSAAIIVTPMPRFLSFTNIVEAHILAGLRKEKIALERIRRAVTFVDKYFKLKHALASQQFETDGVDLFIARLDGGIINASRGGQDAMRAILKTHLRRVEYEHGRAIRLFPLHRDAAPKLVVIDPHRAFGRPVLDGTSVPIEDIFSRWKRGESFKQLASDYEVAQSDIEEALRAAKAA